MSDSEMIVVAAGAVRDVSGRVVITRRADHLHQGGLWEFPGGKQKPGEPIYTALVRELQEELGIRVENARPLIRIPYHYPDRSVVLDVWNVIQFHGEPKGMEGQPIRWVWPRELGSFHFPAANLPIIKALLLPDFYLITPEPQSDLETFLQQLRIGFDRGVRLIQLRIRSLDAANLEVLARRLLELARYYNAEVLLNGHPEQAFSLGAQGVHLSSARLMATEKRPLPETYWVGASCHNRTELIHAAQIGADFAVLSPVLTTPSHPNALPLGWECFADLVSSVPLPVYALGGMKVQHRTTAWQHGAQGIAAIRGLWNNLSLSLPEAR